MNHTAELRESTDPGSLQRPVVPGGPSPIDSQDLLRGQNAIAITHNGSVYRLQTTRQGKLILTK